MGLLTRSGSSGSKRVRDDWASFSVRIPRALQLALKAQVLAECQAAGDHSVFLQDILPDVIREGLKARQKRLRVGG